MKPLVRVLICGIAVSCKILLAQTNSSPPSEGKLVAAEHSPRVRLETELGNLVLELDAKHAPITVSNFLNYVRAGLCDGGSFFRTVTLSNQPNDAVKIQVIQAEANTARRREYFSAIPMERTRDTGLQHHDGTLSMARNGPDTGRDSWSICIGDQPEMDFGGKRNPDGQGFAAFGQVIQGMEIVRKIQALPSDARQRLTPAVPIRKAIRIDQ